MDVPVENLLAMGHGTTWKAWRETGAGKAGYMTELVG
jgi:hypothetical protein